MDIGWNVDGNGDRTCPDMKVVKAKIRVLALRPPSKANNPTKKLNSKCVKKTLKHTSSMKIMTQTKLGLVLKKKDLGKIEHKMGLGNF